MIRMKVVDEIIKQRGGFDSLIAQGKAIKVLNPPYMALCIEHIGTGPHGLPMISVAHYGEQNGDAMRDPDMVFEVGGDLVGWSPVSFRNDYLGLEQEAAWKDAHGRVLIRPKLVADLKRFAATWDRNLRQQGFDKVPVLAPAEGKAA